MHSQNLHNLPGWRWATITKVALDRLSRSLHSDVCDSDGCCDAVAHSRISGRGSRRSRAAPNNSPTNINQAYNYCTRPVRQAFCTPHECCNFPACHIGGFVFAISARPFQPAQLSFHDAPIFRLLLKIAVF